MKRFIGFLMMVLFIGAFTGFGNTIADLTENSEKVITVSADDVITADVVILKMVKRNILHERVNVSSTNSFNNKSSKTNDVHNYVSNYSLYQNKKPYNCARDKLSCN